MDTVCYIIPMYEVRTVKVRARTSDRPSRLSLLEFCKLDGIIISQLIKVIPGFNAR